MSEYGFVYMFFRNKDDEKPVYVGFTSNPIQRLSGHFKENASGNGKLDKKAYKQITHIKVAHVGTEEDARLIEFRMIRKYCPEFNTDAIPPWGAEEKIDVPDWRKWASFSKSELIKDKTVVFRCMIASNDDCEMIAKLESEVEKLRNDLCEERAKATLTSIELRSKDAKIERLSNDVEFWKHQVDTKYEIIDNYKKLVDMQRTDASYLRNMCKSYRERSDNMPFAAKLLSGFTMQMVGAK